MIPWLQRCSHLLHHSGLLRLSRALSHLALGYARCQDPPGFEKASPQPLTSRRRFLSTCRGSWAAGCAETTQKHPLYPLVPTPPRSIAQRNQQGKILELGRQSQAPQSTKTGVLSPAVSASVSKFPGSRRRFPWNAVGRAAVGQNLKSESQEISFPSYNFISFDALSSPTTKSVCCVGRCGSRCVAASDSERRLCVLFSFFIFSILILWNYSHERTRLGEETWRACSVRDGAIFFLVHTLVVVHSDRGNGRRGRISPFLWLRLLCRRMAADACNLWVPGWPLLLEPKLH